MYEEDDLMGSSQTPEYGRPESTFSEESSSSSYMDEQFQGFQANQQLLKNTKTNFDSSKAAYDQFAKQHEAWGRDLLGQMYDRDLAPRLGADTKTAEQMYQELDAAYGYMEDGVPEQWSKVQQEYHKRKQQLGGYENLMNQHGTDYANLSSLNAQVSPAHRAAYDNWKTTSGGRKLNGKDSPYMNPKKANEVLDFIDFDKPGMHDEMVALRAGGLDDIDPRHKFGNIASDDRMLNDKQRERRIAIMRGDMEAMWGEVSRAKRVKSAGFQVAPSWMNAIGGVNRMLGKPGEAEATLAYAAQQAGIDYFTNSKGERVSVDEYIQTSEYTPEELNALSLMNKLGSAKAEHDQMQIDFWANLDSLKGEKEDSDSWNAMQLKRQERDSLVKQLEAMGYGREMYARGESVKDKAYWSGAWESGAIQDDMADFSDNIFLGNMDKSDWEDLAALAEEQDALSRHLAENDHSPLAKITRLSQEHQDGTLAAIGRWFGFGEGSSAADGIQALGELTATQLRGFMMEYVETAPATIGTFTAGGALVGGGVPGGVAGFGWGARVNWGVASAAMEYTASILQYMREEGVDVHNPQALTAAWTNDGIRNRVRDKAAKKTGIVSLFDVASAGVAGKTMGLARTPSVVTKVPHAVLPSKQNLVGHTLSQTKRMKELKKLNKKGKIQRGSPEAEELQKLEEMIKTPGKVIPGGRLENEFSKALAKSDAGVNRSTLAYRLRNVGVEAGVQMGFGGGGEALSQAWANEPGQPIDKQAVLAEMFGEIGGGPAVLGMAKEAFTKPDFKNYRNTVTESQEELNLTAGDNPLGYSGQPATVRNMNNSGNRFQQAHFENHEDAVKWVADNTNTPMFVEDEKGNSVQNPEIMFQNELIRGIQSLVQGKGGRLEFAIGDRTPSSTTQPGEMEFQAENNTMVIHLNTKVINATNESLTGVLLHEIGHVYGHGIAGSEKVKMWYSRLSDEQKEQAFAHYFFKDRLPVTDISKLDAKDKLELEKAWDPIKASPENEDRLAQEWFTFEFARVLAGSQRDQGTGTEEQVQAADLVSQVTTRSKLPAGETANIRAFTDKWIHPLIAKWTGTGARVNTPARPVGDAGPGGMSPAIADGMDADARPMKMSPDEMDAQILEHMQWGVAPDGQVRFNGEGRAYPSGERQDTIKNLGEMRNKAIGDEAFLRNMNGLVNMNPALQEAVKVRKEYGPSGEQFDIVEDKVPPLVSPERVRIEVEQGLEAQREEDLAVPQGGFDAASQQKSTERLLGIQSDINAHRRTISKHDEAIEKLRKEDPNNTEGVERLGLQKAHYEERLGELEAEYDQTLTEASTTKEFTEDQQSQMKETILKEMDESSRRAAESEKLGPLKKRDEKGAVDYDIPETDAVGTNSIKGFKEFFERVEAVEGKKPKTVGDYTMAKKGSEALTKAIETAVKGNKNRINFKPIDQVLTVDEAVKLRDALVGMKTAWEKVAEEKVAEETTKLNVGVKKNQYGRFVPRMSRDKEGKLIADPPVSDEKSKKFTGEFQTAVALSGEDKILKAAGTSYSQITEEAVEFIEKDPQALMDTLLNKAHTLFAQKGRLTNEELFAKVAREIHLDKAQDAELSGARGALSDNAEAIDLESINEAYTAWAEEQGAYKVELIEKRLNELQADIEAQKQTIKGAQDIGKVPTPEEGKQLSNEQVGTLVGSLKAALSNYDGRKGSGDSQKAKLKNFFMDVISTKEPAQVDDISDKLSEFLSGPVLKDTKKTDELKSLTAKLDWLLKPIEGQTTVETTERTKAMFENKEALLEALNAGNIVSISNKEQADTIASAERRKTTLEAKRKEIDAMRGSVASATATIDFRNVKVAFNFKPDHPDLQGTNYGDLVMAGGSMRAKDGSITLGDLAEFDKIKVKYRKAGEGKKDQTFTINGKHELMKLSQNFGWSDTAKLEFEKETGQNWAEYQSNILAALASVRPGRTEHTQHGPKDTIFAKADEGSTLPAVLMEAISRLKGFYNFKRKSFEKGSPEQKAYIEKYGIFEGMTNFLESDSRKNRARENAVKKLPDHIELRQKHEELMSSLAITGKEPKDSTPLSKILESEGYKKERNKKANQVVRSGKTRFGKQWEFIDKFLHDNKKAKLKKGATWGALKEAYGVDRAAFREVAKQIPKDPNIDLSVDDHLIVNLTGSYVAELLAERDTTQVGVTHVPSKWLLDYALYTERELLKDIRRLREEIGEKLAVREEKTFARDNHFDEGDLFWIGNQLYKAKQDFRVTGSTVHNIDLFANRADLGVARADKGGFEISGPNEMDYTDNFVKLNKEQLAKKTQQLNLALKQLNKLHSLAGHEFFHNDLMAKQPGYKDQFGDLQSIDHMIHPSTKDIMVPMETKEYRHLLMVLNEAVAEGGPGGRGYLNKVTGKSKGNQFDPYSTTSFIIPKLNERYRNALRDIMPMSSEQALNRAISEMRAIQKALSVTNYDDTRQPNGLDFAVNLGLEYARARKRRDIMLPRELRGVLQKYVDEDGVDRSRWITDPETIFKDEKLKEQYEKQTRELEKIFRAAKLPMPLDTLRYKGDPIVTALSDDSRAHNTLRTHLEQEILENKLNEEKGVIEIKMTWKEAHDLVERGAIDGKDVWWSEDLKEGSEITVHYDKGKQVKRRVLEQESVDVSETIGSIMAAFDTKETVFEKGEYFAMDGKRVKVLAKIDSDHYIVEGLKEAFLDGNINQNKMEGAFKQLVHDNSDVFQILKKDYANAPVQLTINSPVVDFEIKRKQEELALLEKAVLDDAYGSTDKNMDRHHDAIKQLKDQLDIVEKFRNGDLKAKTKWRFQITRGDEKIATAIEKNAAGGWDLLMMEPGAFVKQGKNKQWYALSDKMQNALLQEFAAKYFIKSEENVGRGPNDSNPSQVVQEMNSLMLTARTLIEEVVKMGGIDQIQKLEGSFKQFYKDTPGAVPLLRYMPHVIDIFLDKLADAGVIKQRLEKVREQIGHIRDAQDAAKSTYHLRNELANLQQKEESLQSQLDGDVSYSDQVFIDYVANMRMSQSAKHVSIVEGTESPLSKGDKTSLDRFVKNETKQSFYIALQNQAFTQGQIVKVGQTEAVKDENGKITEPSKPVYGKVSYDSLNEEGNPERVSSAEYVEADVGSLMQRWPNTAQKFKKEKSKDKETSEEGAETKETEETEDKYDTSINSFVYKIDIEYDPNKTKSLFEEAYREKFIQGTQEERESYRGLHKIIKNIEALTEDTAEDSSYIIEIQKASKAFDKAFAIKDFQKDIKGNSLQELLIEDIKKPNSKYFQHKLKALMSAVHDMGGIKVMDVNQILEAQEKIDKQFESGADGMKGTTKDPYSTDPDDFDSDNFVDPDPDSPETGGPSRSGDTNPDDLDSESTQRGEDMEDEPEAGMRGKRGANYGGAYEAGMFTRPPSQWALGRLAKGAYNAYESWRTKSKDPNAVPDELDPVVNAGNTSNIITGHKGAYGRLVEQFGPWLKVQDDIVEKMGLKGSKEGKDLEVYDTFYSQMGRAGDLLDRGQRSYVNPVSDALYESKASMKDVGWYLYALIAPQANRAVDRSRKNMGLERLEDKHGHSNGSGMSDAEAKTLIQRLERDSIDTDGALVKFLKHKNNPIKLMFDMHHKALILQEEAELLDTGSRGRMESAATVADEKYAKDLHVVEGLNFGTFRRLPLKGLLGLEDQYALQEDAHDLLGSGTATGRGFDMPHGSTYLETALGREVYALADPETIFAHTTQSWQQAVIMSTRAKSAQKINDMHDALHLAKLEDPESTAGKLFDQIFAEPEPVEKWAGYLDTEVLDANNNPLYKYKKMNVPAEIANSGRALFVREKGQPKLIMFAETEEGRLLASAAKNLTYEQLNTFMRVLNVPTKYYARVRTSWNPEFWAANPIKDMLTSWINLRSEPEFKKISGKVANPISFPKHAGAIFNYEKAIDAHGVAPKGMDNMETNDLVAIAKEGDITAAYALLKKLGGKTAFYKFNEISELQKQNIEASKKPRKGGKVTGPVRKVVNFVNNLNTSLENVLRARVIMEGLKAGMDIDVLIPSARDVTVDFNKRGTWSQQAGVLVQFFNPGVQGNRRFIKALRARGTLGAFWLGGKITLASYMYNMLMRSLTAREPDEEDDLSTDHDDISPYTRYTSMVLPHSLLGDESKTPGHTKIPIAYGPHGAWALGDFLSKQHITGGRDAVKDALEFVEVMYRTYSPYAPIPTNPGDYIPYPAYQTLNQIAANEKWNGAPIYNELPGNDRASPVQMSKRNTPEIYKMLSEGANTLAGGNAHVPGNLISMLTFNDPIQVAGEAGDLGGMFSGPGLEFLTKEIGGSILSSAFDGANLFTADTKTKEIPILKRVVRMRGTNYRTYQEYEDLRVRAKQASSHLDSMDHKAKKDFLQEKPHYLKIIKAFESSETGMSMYRRRRTALENQPSSDRQIQELDKLDDMRNNIQRRAIGVARAAGIKL